MDQLQSILQFCNSNAPAIKAIGSLGTLIVGIVAFLKYRSSQEKAAARDEQAIFDSIDATYMDLNKIMLAHPALDASWFSDDQKRILSEEQRLQQSIIFDMTTRLFERAFLVFTRASSSHRARQWSGWEAYIEDYCKKESFHRWWNTRDWPLRSDADGELDQYDKRFLEFMAAKMSAAQKWRDARDRTR